MSPPNKRYPYLQIITIVHHNHLPPKPYFYSLCMEQIMPAWRTDYEIHTEILQKKFISSSKINNHAVVKNIESYPLCIRVRITLDTCHFIIVVITGSLLVMPILITMLI